MPDFRHLSLDGRLARLRPPEPEDWRFVHRWLNDPTVMPYWGGLDQPLTENEAWHWVASFTAGDPGLAAKIIETEGKPVGFIEMSWEDDDNYRHKVELDICIGEPGRWGKGLGTDSLITLLRGLFLDGGFERVFLQPRAVNMRAVRCYEKAGFQKEGIARSGEKVDGVLYDTVLMGALKSEWLLQFGSN